MLRKKYSIVPICVKESEIRSVLISYEDKCVQKGSIIQYLNTKLIAKHPYFDNKTSSHKYVFYDDGYALMGVDNTNKIYESYLLNSKRAYHYNTLGTTLSSSLKVTPVEFKAFTKRGALNKFKKYNKRKELK